MKKQRVLFITPLPPPVHGSAMVSKWIMESEAIRGEFDCDFVNLSLSRSMDEIQTFSATKIMRLMMIYGRVMWKLMTRRYDLCYCAIACFGTPFLKDAPVALMCRLFGRRVIIHQHNKGMRQYCHKQIYRQLYRMVYRKAKVMLLSWRLYDDIADVVAREQVEVCPNGIPDCYPEAAIDSPDSGGGAVKLLFLSNIIPSKGCNVLLEALALLKGRGVEVECDFVGGDCPEQSAEDFAKLIRQMGLEGIASYAGRKYGSEKDEYWRKADVFVFPTYYAQECFPIVLLESMQHGVACITTREAAIPDIVEDGVNGLLCKAQDAKSLAGCIERLASDKELRLRMGEAGRRRYMERFTLEAFERRFVNVMRGI